MNPIECEAAHGLWSGTIEDVIERIRGEALLLASEPANGPQRLKGFQGLCTAQAWRPCAGAAVAEARIFFPPGVLHLLAHTGGVRWAAWREAGTEAPWWPGDPKGSRKASLAKTLRPILLRGERAVSGPERGLRCAALGKSVDAHEYHSSGRLVWWRLSPNAH